LSSGDALQSLENLLESFLERAVGAKEERLRVLSGVNRLDDIARTTKDGRDITESLGEWFAEHNLWLSGDGLRPADALRINEILTEIREGLTTSADTSPALDKLGSEIDRWGQRATSTAQKLVLKRGPETPTEPAEGSIALFDRVLKRVANLYADSSVSRQHILSALDDSLESAKEQKSKDALLLSAFIIYYLKLNNYLVDPYVKRLKEAESVIRSESRHA